MDFGIVYLKQLELKYPTKNVIYKLIYHFDNVNTYLWCYQYAGPKKLT